MKSKIIELERSVLRPELFNITIQIDNKQYEGIIFKEVENESKLKARM